MVRRDAFTLLELIFAIVVIAISVVSLPRMTQVTAEGIDESLVQEAIFAGAAELNDAVTYNWDDNSFDINKTDMAARVIDTDGDCNNTGERRRPGHIAGQPKHRRCTDSNAGASIIASALNNVDSFNDISHSSQNIFIDETRNQSGYKKEYDSILAVSHPASFSANIDDDDIKKITITVNDKDGNIVTELRTYSCNIGEIDVYKEVMQ